MLKQINVLFKKMEHAKDLPLPAYASEGASGLDLLAAVDRDILIAPGEFKLIPTGIAVALPAGYEGQIRPRSGLALNYGLTVLNAPGTIDADYRGEIQVIMINLGRENYRIQRGERIAQLVVNELARVKIIAVEKLPATDRGSRGFGHSGKF
ncbi:MAG TPA: dUTP diphosphatase [Firmicutes bacterium]|nr:dUTP diphosphatase [Bacillota bacterium]